MDVGANPVQEEVLVKGLSWNLQNVASSILSSEKAVFTVLPGNFGLSQRGSSRSIAQIRRAG